MKSFVLAVCLSLFACCVVAQSNMVPGYIVTTKGDTLRGFILDRNNKWSVSSISFATSASGTHREYGVGEISTMYLQSYDATYQSRFVEIDKKPVGLAHQLESDGTRRITSEALLLEQVVRGRINLYDYIDENGKRHFFVQKEGSKTEELPYVKYLTAEGRIVEMRFFRGTLQGLTTDCSKIGDLPSRLERKVLTRYITEYNLCMGDGEVAKATLKNKLIGTAFGGVSFGSGSFMGVDATNNGVRITRSNGKYGNSIAYNVGIFFELHSSRASKRWRPGFQVFYQKTGTMTKVTTAGLGGEYTLGFSLVHFGPTFKYILTRQKSITSYLKAGLSGVAVLNDDGIRTYPPQSPRTPPPGVYAEFKPFGYSGSAGVGVQWKMVNLEVRYQLAQAPTKFLAAGQYKGVDVLLGIQLYK